MDLMEALSLFQFNLSDLTEENLRKKYRTLAKKYHPDLRGDTVLFQKINAAHEELKNTLVRISKQKLIIQACKPNVDDSRIFVLGLQEIIDIYDGKKFETHGENPIKIGISELRRFNIMVNLVVNLVYDGLDHSFELLVPYNTKDEFSIDTVVYVSDLSDEKEVTLKSLDKEFKFTTAADKIINLRFKNNVMLKVSVKRQVIVDGEQGK